MNYLLGSFETIDVRFTIWMSRYRLEFLCYSLGIVFLWFGVLKFFPGEVFTRVPYAPILEGQYIIKNIVIVSTGIVLGATVRGGRLVAVSDHETGEMRDIYS